MRKSNRTRKLKTGKVAQVKCEICGEPATHSIIANIRERPGPPLAKDNVLRSVCEEHSKGSFNELIPPWQWDAVSKAYKQQHRIIISKKYSDIQVVKLKRIAE